MHVCVKMKTRQHSLRKCARRSVDVVAGVRIVLCHASIDVVIDVRVMECHAIIDVVIGVRVVLCHQAIKFQLLHRGNLTFEVWYLHTPSVTVDRRQL